MSLSMNPGRPSFPLDEFATRDSEAQGPAKSIRFTQPNQTENRVCISFPRKPYDQVEDMRFNSSRGNWHWNIRTDTTIWSEQLYRMIGREHAEVPPFKEHSRFYTSESWIRLVDSTLELLQTGTPYELTLQMLHTDGGRRWVIRNGEAVTNEHGDILELWGTVQEISKGMAQGGNSEGDWRKRSIDVHTTGRLIQAQVEENAKLAIELRGSTCQTLSLLAVQIDNLRSTLPDLAPQAQAQLEAFRQSTTEILVELDRVSDRLYPVVVDVLSLPPAIGCLCRKFTREHGIPVEYSCSDVPANRLDKPCEFVLYRVLQEILANVARHSRATNVTVGLDHDATELRLRVLDNGVGFDQTNAEAAAGLGFARMKIQIGYIEGSFAARMWHVDRSSNSIH
jgi:two-component system, NarL family, sensor histidine kinase UhpB